MDFKLAGLLRLADALTVCAAAYSGTNRANLLNAVAVIREHAAIIPASAWRQAINQRGISAEEVEARARELALAHDALQERAGWINP